MIFVTTPTAEGAEVHEFDTVYCEIIDGALVIHERRNEQFVTVAGFAPGAWITYEVGD